MIVGLVGCGGRCVSVREHFPLVGRLGDEQDLDEDASWLSASMVAALARQTALVAWIGLGWLVSLLLWLEMAIVHVPCT